MKLCKRICAALLALIMLAGLAGCENVPGADRVQELLATPGPAPTLPPAPDPLPQTLTVREGRTLQKALKAYAAANNVTLANDGAADLVLLDIYPESGATGESTLLDLNSDPLLAAAAARAGLDGSGPLYAFPVGRCLYGYWADTAVLAELLGENYQNDLRAATWAEWSALVGAVTAWIADPAAAQRELTLNGNPYTLPAEKPEAAARLTAVFDGSDGGWGNCGPLFAPVLLAAGDTRSQETLYGALNGLCSTLLLENANSTADITDSADALASGQVLFTRRPLCDLTAALDADTLARLTVLPVKSDLVEEDLFTGEYNLTGLLNYPILTDAGWLAIPADRGTDSVKAAAAALLWLYGSAGGEQALTEDELLITPWDTAGDTSPLGAWQVQQVENGILPAPALTEAQLDGVNAAVLTLQSDAAAAASDKALQAAREAFLQNAVAALADPGQAPTPSLAE